MDKFLIKRPRNLLESSGGSTPSPRPNLVLNSNCRVEFDPNDIISDPGLRKPIEEFDVRIRDRIRREYISKGPCQPNKHNYPKSQCGKLMRTFQEDWFRMHDWLEYSISKDAAYYFCCYLFKPTSASHFGDEVFVKKGFKNWKRTLDKFKNHVGGVNSVHHDVKRDEEFSNIEDLGTLAKKMVATKKSCTYLLVYRLIELGLLLLVATASVERVFSAMNIIMTILRNRMEDEWLNGSLVVYIERDVFIKVDSELILDRFQKMASSRIQLPSRDNV